LVLYKAVGHGVHLAQPIRVVNDIVDFLARPAQKGTVQV
jgi:hypothetical protein